MRIPITRIRRGDEGPVRVRFPDAMPKNISLTLEDFRTLIRGEIVSRDGVNIALQDIGYTYTLQEVRNAARDYLADYMDRNQVDPEPSQDRAEDNGN